MSEPTIIDDLKATIERWNAYVERRAGSQVEIAPVQPSVKVIPLPVPVSSCLPAKFEINRIGKSDGMVFRIRRISP
jgi:hypothetical protein